MQKKTIGNDAESETVVQLESGSRQSTAAEPSTADNGDNMARVNSVGKEGKGLGVFAKMKRRFGRHAG